MCGIAGVYSNGDGSSSIDIESTLEALHHRGPDHQSAIQVGKLRLLHTRLSIIDPSTGSHQPMSDPSQRYHLSFNGEIYNYRSIREALQRKGISFNSQGDTEVVLQQLIVEGIQGLNAFHGFFSLAFYDAHEDRLILARDRFGIKPLLYAYNGSSFAFASELQALKTMIEPKKMDTTSMHLFFTLNYIPGPKSIEQDIKKLMPGNYLTFTNGSIAVQPYYTKPVIKHPENTTFAQHSNRIRELLETSITDRLVADVPLGTFLSGGLDSSIITMVAAQHKKGIESFSVGFKSNTYFDESEYAELVAKKAGTQHHTILLEEDDMLHCMGDFIAAIDEPFADSSAIAYYLLSKHTRKKVTVALSGDGADELFAGYNKYKALQKSMQNSSFNSLIKKAHPLLNLLPDSRSTALGNKLRQVKKYAQGMRLSNYERYWEWSRFTSRSTIDKLLKTPANKNEIQRIQESFLTKKDTYSLNEILESDQKLVMVNDMLFKADKMSMAHGLEVRVPFLDHRVVEYVQSLPGTYKMDASVGKKILREAFKDMIPSAIMDRPKKGFEVPLEAWFAGPLKEEILSLLAHDFIMDQGIFHDAPIKALKNNVLHNRHSADVHLLWKMYIFQHYWKRTYS